MQQVYLGIVLAPLLPAILVGLFRRQVGRAGASLLTILGVGIAFVLSLMVLNHHVIEGAAPYDGTLYTWMISDGIRFQVGFLVDNLTAVMITVVTFVSLMVHVYTIGYMHDDPGYQRFFAYISLFTFAMLMLVMANNFHAAVLRLGRRGPGLLPADRFLVHAAHRHRRQSQGLPGQPGRRLRLPLGIAGVLMYCNSLDYAQVFAAHPSWSARPWRSCRAMPGR